MINSSQNNHFITENLLLLTALKNQNYKIKNTSLNKKLTEKRSY